MKKTIVGLGMVIILVGLIFIFSSSYSNDTSKSEYQEISKQWTASMDLDQGQVMGFSFVPDNDWSIETYDLKYILINGEQTAVKYFEVTVTNPQLNYTMVRLVLVITVLNGGASQMSVYPDYLEVYNKTSPEMADWVLANQSTGFDDPAGALVIGKGYPKAELIGNETMGSENVFQIGRAPIQGTYNLTCTLNPELVNDRLAPNGSLWIHEVSPPPILRAYKTTICTEHPYILLLPVGVSVSIVGIIIMLWGYMSKKQIKRTMGTKNDKNQ